MPESIPVTRLIKFSAALVITLKTVVSEAASSKIPFNETVPFVIASNMLLNN